MTTPCVAIVGSGPSGCYLAQALRKEWPESEITLFDKLPVPFGLIRYGVAPDHIGTKAIARQFDRLFTREGIGFIGNITIGRDIALDLLRDAYDIVVLAVGLYGDHKLDIPGEDLSGVYAAGSITRLFNDHPDESDSQYDLGKNCVIIGNGNVAIDILRLISKSEEKFDGSEVSDYSLSRIGRNNLKEINIVGRSSIADAKFDDLMIKELQFFDRVRFVVHGIFTDQEKKSSRYLLLKSLEKESFSRDADVEINFYFCLNPIEIHGDSSVNSVDFMPAGGNKKLLSLKADSVITAIGFNTAETCCFEKMGLLGNESLPDQGRLDTGLYCVGWFKRGPRGSIPDNRTDSKTVANQIVEDYRLCKKQRTGLGSLAEKINSTTDYVGWKRIDALEISNAENNRSRKKITSISEMIKVASQ